MTRQEITPQTAPGSEGIRAFEPFTVHFLAPMTVRIADLNSHVFVRGDEFTITPLIWAFSEDRNGASWLDVLDEPALQLAQWGVVRFARGPWPNGKPKHLPGSPEADEKKAEDWAAVWDLPYGEVRNARRAELRAEYGTPPTAIMTLGFEPGGAPL